MAKKSNSTPAAEAGEPTGTPDRTPRAASVTAKALSERLHGLVSALAAPVTVLEELREAFSDEDTVPHHLIARACCDSLFGEVRAVYIALDKLHRDFSDAIVLKSGGAA